MTKLISEAWDLEVFKLAYKISLIIHKASQTFPQIERFEIASQIRRCSKSICANIAEGFAKQRFSEAEFKRFLSMALGSASEMQVWIRYCEDLEYISEDTANEWRQTYTSIARMLAKLHSTI